MRVLASFVLVLLAVVPAPADTMYTYTGSLFTATSGVYTTADRITGYFVLRADYVPPLTMGFVDFTAGLRSYSFTDGHQTLTNADSTGSFTTTLKALQDRQASTFSEWWSVRLTTSDSMINTLRGTDRADVASLGAVGIVPGGTFGLNSDGTLDGVIRGSTFAPPGSWNVQTVPERAILPRLPKLLPRLFGWGVEAKITHGLQRTTTWLAAAILRAPHDGTKLYLPSVTVEVIEDCAGREAMMLMLLVAGLIAAVMPKKKAILIPLLFGAAAILALEANVLRVAGISLGLQHLGVMSREGKDWIQMGTTGLAMAQLLGLGRLAARV